jgi:putative acetyltransferase
LIVRDAKEEEQDEIAALHRAAFGGPVEAAIVRALDDNDLIVLSAVAVIGGAVVGHVLYSRLETEIDGRKVRALALAPMAVKPMRQRQGIGTRLLNETLARLSKTKYEAVIVVGHPDYYPRFGFSAGLAKKLASPYAGDAFMALELKDGALSGDAGSVTYPDAFTAAENLS